MNYCRLLLNRSMKKTDSRGHNDSARESVNHLESLSQTALSVGQTLKKLDLRFHSH